MKKTLFFLFLAIQTTFCQWRLNDKTPSTVSAAPNAQRTFAVNVDEQGNSFYTWADFRDNNVVDIYAQKLDSRGNVQWAKDGVWVGRIFDKNQDFYTSKIIKGDEKGGAFVLWERAIDPNSTQRHHLYAQYITSDGKTQWQTGGIRITQQEHFVQDPYYDVLDVYDLKNNQLLFIYNTFNQSTDLNTVYTKRIDFSGNIVDGEKKLFDNQGNQSKVLYDEANRRILTIRKGGVDNLFQAFDFSNAPIGNAASFYDNPFSGGSRIDYFKTDKAGNAYVGRTLFGNDGRRQVYAQKIGTDLKTVWNVAVGSNIGFDIQIAPGNDGGGVVSWIEMGDRANPYRIAKINSTGSVVWQKNIFNPKSSREYFLPNKLVPNGKDGAYALWFTPSNPNYDLTVQHFDKDGNMKFPEDGLIFTGFEFYSDYRPLTYPSGGLIVAFGGVRNNEIDLYANYVNENGTFGFENGISITNTSTKETCAGTSFSVNINATGIFRNDNNFRVFLSDKNGNFDANSIQIGSDAKTTIQVKTPPSLAAGTYKIKVVSTNPIIESQNSAEIKISEIAAPNITSDKPAVCSNDASVILKATGCETGIIKWINGQTGASITAKLDANTTFSAVCNVSGCAESKASNSVEVKVNRVSATASNPATYLEGEEIKLSSSGGTKYEWTGPNNFSSSNQNPTIPQSKPTMSGTYSVKVTDANNCFGIATTSVTVNPILSKEIPNDYSLKIFPNPTQNQLSIQFNALPNEVVNISLTDLQGKNIFNKNIQAKGGVQTELIDIQGFNRGSYILKIKEKSYKIIIE